MKMNVKCSVCHEVFELKCDGSVCSKSDQMQLHENKHNSNGESISWIV